MGQKEMVKKENKKKSKREKTERKKDGCRDNYYSTELFSM
jgi:hypothetical protein